MEYKGDGGHNVKTGDETNVVLWFGLLAVSMAGIVGVIFFRKKRKIK
jgi:LPXTG-motif cell wall-anchored protein